MLLLLPTLRQPEYTSHLSKIQNQPERIIHANLPTIETLRILPVRTLAVQTTAKNQKQNTPKAGRLA